MHFVIHSLLGLDLRAGSHSARWKSFDLSILKSLSHPSLSYNLVSIYSLVLGHSVLLP